VFAQWDFVTYFFHRWPWAQLEFKMADPKLGLKGQRGQKILSTSWNVLELTPEYYYHVGLLDGQHVTNVSQAVLVLWDASQSPGACWDLPHWVSSAALTSLSSSDKDEHNLPLSFRPFSPLSLSLASPLFFATFLLTQVSLNLCPLFFLLLLFFHPPCVSPSLSLSLSLSLWID